MDDRKTVISDLLQDRGKIDQWGFVLFALLGGIGIVSGKSLGISEGYVAAGAVIAIFVYAAMVARSGTGRLRSDQAGDNCYYLGLIYTLCSLAYAIVTFDPMGTATTIIQGFGIALATTIVGLVLRVFFNQGRPDLEDFEEQARLEITGAISQLKTELGQAVRNMNDLNRQIVQSISEANEAATKDIVKFASKATTDLQTVITSAKSAVETEAEAFTSRTKRFGSTIDKMITGLENHDTRLEKLLQGQEGLTTSLQAIQTAASQSQAMTMQLAGQSELIGTAIQALATSSGEIRTTVSAIVGEVNTSLNELKTAPRAAIDMAGTALLGAAKQAGDEIVKVAKAHQQTADQIGQQAGLALQTTKAHNADLEQELRRSRELLEKVHLELVAVTGELVRRVEGRS
jgi:vacuolar-type H+-ATPase subunit H